MSIQLDAAQVHFLKPTQIKSEYVVYLWQDQQQVNSILSVLRYQLHV